MRAMRRPSRMPCVKTERFGFDLQANANRFCGMGASAPRFKESTGARAECAVRFATHRGGQRTDDEPIPLGNACS